jgi:uncharacterized membrane protein YtjA (UPF0391 family)
MTVRRPAAWLLVSLVFLVAALVGLSTPAGTAAGVATYA